MWNASDSARANWLFGQMIMAAIEAAHGRIEAAKNKAPDGLA